MISMTDERVLAGSELSEPPEASLAAGDLGEESPAKILVVDDDPAIVEIVGEYLNIQGLAVVSATSGIEALRRLELDRPDAVLLDVRMPEMDGIETLRRITALKTGVQVLMVSANDDLALAKEAIALGAVDFLLKPFDFGYLSRALDHITRRPSRANGAGSGDAAPAGGDSGPVSPYDLALAVCQTTRRMPPATRRVVGAALERIAVGLVRQGPGGERRRLIRQLTDLRNLLRFAKDLGEIADDVHRQLESQIVRTRRGLGSA
ncbi:MAG TPA: response regulator [Candidatus Methylomirabilis sp.]|nr:response regulator [Candidatus Methylomirabilis sp.]